MVNGNNVAHGQTPQPQGQPYGYDIQSGSGTENIANGTAPRRVGFQNPPSTVMSQPAANQT
jgi:hypothetical protein